MHKFTLSQRPSDRIVDIEEICCISFNILKQHNIRSLQLSSLFRSPFRNKFRKLNFCVSSITQFRFCFSAKCGFEIWSGQSHHKVIIGIRYMSLSRTACGWRRRRLTTPSIKSETGAETVFHLKKDLDIRNNPFEFTVTGLSNRSFF